jgi:hypothetical protein
MMNWKGVGRERSWPNFKVGLLSGYSPGGTEVNHKNINQGSRSPEPRIEPETCRVRSRSVKINFRELTFLKIITLNKRTMLLNNIDRLNVSITNWNKKMIYIRYEILMDVELLMMFLWS